MKTPKNRIIRPPAEPAPASPQSDSSVVTVRVVRQAVGEDGRAYLAGETFTTTPGRANALGPLVERI